MLVAGGSDYQSTAGSTTPLRLFPSAPPARDSLYAKRHSPERIAAVGLFGGINDATPPT